LHRRCASRSDSWQRLLASGVTWRHPLKRKSPRPPLAAAPMPRTAGKPPQGQRVPAPRTGNPAAQAPPPRSPTRVPKARPVGKVPNPRSGKLVREVHGDLNDLFAFFPDLPRPHRSRPRAPRRRGPRGR
jgi:hypothetical protein